MEKMNVTVVSLLKRAGLVAVKLVYDGKSWNVVFKDTTGKVRKLNAERIVRRDLLNILKHDDFASREVSVG